jgi:hypothetical protein
MKLILKLFIVFTLVSSNSHAINKAFYAIKRADYFQTIIILKAQER